MIVFRRQVILEADPTTPGDNGYRWLEIRVPLNGEAPEYVAERRLLHSEPERYSVDPDTFRDLMRLST